ncbi:MAG TPA: SufD family Fe-S cluster assembly protein [Myxococcota bacterium]|nr:SufD family Fe-S cluster assembly protein [Myxococcota bacterium]
MKSDFAITIENDSREPLTIDVAKNPVVHVKKGAEAELLIEERASGQGHVRIVVDEEASLRLFALSMIEEGQSHALTAEIELADKARLFFHDIQLSLGHFGLNAQVMLNGEHAKFSYGGLQLLKGAAKSGTELEIAHQGAHSESTQAFRGIYGGSSQGLFLGKVVVGEKARQCSAEQLYKAVLLSKDAEALVRPQLEINNRHIKASHGASIGMLDEEALFYLCSRGLSKVEAKTLLVQSLARAILDQMGESKLALRLLARIESAILNSMAVLP